MNRFKKGLCFLLTFILLCGLSLPVYAASELTVSLSTKSSSVESLLTATKDKTFDVFFGVDDVETDTQKLNTYKFTIWYDPDYLSVPSSPIEQLASPNGYALYDGAETESKTISGKAYNGYTYSYTSYSDGFTPVSDDFYALNCITFSADKVGTTKIYITKDEISLLPLHSDTAPDTLDFDLGKSTLNITIEKSSGGGGGGGGGPSGPSGPSNPQPAIYTVTFIMGEASQDVAVLANGYVTAPTPAERENYTFVGWYKDREYKTPFDFSKPITGNATVYGRYTFNEPEPDVDFKNPFTDVAESDWFYDSVMYALQNKLVAGTSETTFSPYEVLTRGTMVTLLYRIEKEPEAPKNPFTDVEAGMWYEDAIAWAAEEGVVLGVGEGLFAPEDPITREQIAVILYKYARLKGEDVSKTASLDAYSDKETVSDWATNAMGWALAQGLIKGTSETTLSPGNNANRAEIVTILMRYLERNQAQ